jgi:hypothetical protein
MQASRPPSKYEPVVAGVDVHVHRCRRRDVEEMLRRGADGPIPVVADNQRRHQFIGMHTRANGEAPQSARGTTTVQR